MSDLIPTPSGSTRRQFLKTSALGAAGFMIVPRHVLGGPGYVAPSDTVNVALVGAGGRGRRNVEALFQLPDVQITALADPAQYWNLANFYYQSEAGRGPVKKMIEAHYAAQRPHHSVTAYNDFRHLLEQQKEVDAVLCATPDHTHAYVSLLAMQAGKHVYCEKPLTHNIWEARQVARVARETGLATQMGNQLHSGDNVRQTVEMLRSGVIGKVSEAYAWVSATRWNVGLTGRPTTSQRTPEGLDWDLWLGPRKMRDFHQTYAPVSWRDYWDFGLGAMGDFGCHDLDAAVWAYDLPAPEEVIMHPAGYSDADITPYGEVGYFRFPAQGDQPSLRLTWYSGGLKPDLPDLLPPELELPGRGAMYIGEKGILLYGGSPTPRLFPEILQESFTLPAPTLPPTQGHHRDWVDAIKGGPAASSHFEYGARLTEITLLGVLSLRLGGKRILWDAENMKAKGLPEADEWIRESVRTGWEMRA